MPKKPVIKPATDKSESYNEVKYYNGEQYTGMKIGRSHKWRYDAGEWKERKVTPDKWEFTYSVTKRRAGHAPEGSGVPVGTGYHWFILSHQFVHKLNANDYSTSMMGLKLKLAHKRANKTGWNTSNETQRKHLVKILQNLIANLENEPENMDILSLDFEYRGETFTGEAIPILTSCKDGICGELDIFLNGEHHGILQQTPKGWHISGAKRQGLVNAIGEAVLQEYEK